MSFTANWPIFILCLLTSKLGVSIVLSFYRNSGKGIDLSEEPGHDSLTPMLQVIVEIQVKNYFYQKW